MVNENKTFELKNEDLEKASGGSDYSKSTIIKNLEKNDSFSDGIFLYVIVDVNNRHGDIVCDKYYFEDGKYVFMSSGYMFSPNELLEMEYKGKFNG